MCFSTLVNLVPVFSIWPIKTRTILAFMPSKIESKKIGTKQKAKEIENWY